MEDLQSDMGLTESDQRRIRQMSSTIKQAMKTTQDQADFFQKTKGLQADLEMLSSSLKLHGDLEKESSSSKIYPKLTKDDDIQTLNQLHSMFSAKFEKLELEQIYQQNCKSYEDTLKFLFKKFKESGQKVNFDTNPIKKSQSLKERRLALYNYAKARHVEKFG